MGGVCDGGHFGGGGGEFLKTLARRVHGGHHAALAGVVDDLGGVTDGFALFENGFEFEPGGEFDGFAEEDRLDELDLAFWVTTGEPTFRDQVADC